MLVVQIVISIIVVYIGVINTLFFIELKNKKNMPIQKPEIKLSFEDCNKIIDNVTEEIYNNKYFLHYRLRDLTIIPNVEADIISLSKDIINAFSNEMLEQIYFYYESEYFIQMITRKSQALIVNYTNTYKPNAK